MSDFNAYETRTNTHFLSRDGEHLACALTKPLPKGESFVTGPAFDSEGNRTGFQAVVCHRCNGVNWNCC